MKTKAILLMVFFLGWVTTCLLYTSLRSPSGYPLDNFQFSIFNCVTVLPAGTSSAIQTLPHIVAPLPIRILPIKVELEYTVT